MENSNLEKLAEIIYEIAKIMTFGDYTVGFPIDPKEVNK